MTRLFLITFSLIASFSTVAADLDLNTLLPSDGSQVRYEKHLGLRVQKLEFRKAARYPALAIARDLSELEAAGWRRCGSPQGWITYKDETTTPKTTAYNNTQILVRDNAVLHLFFAYRLLAGQQINRDVDDQFVSITYAHLDNKAQVRQELQRLEVKCDVGE
jgi:hypothetical protein